MTLQASTGPPLLSFLSISSSGFTCLLPAGIIPVHLDSPPLLSSRRPPLTGDLGLSTASSSTISSLGLSVSSSLSSSSLPKPSDLGSSFTSALAGVKCRGGCAGSGGLLDPLAGPPGLLSFCFFSFRLSSTRGWSFSFFFSGVRLLSPLRLRLLSLSGDRWWCRCRLLWWCSSKSWCPLLSFFSALSSLLSWVLLSLRGSSFLGGAPARSPPNPPAFGRAATPPCGGGRGPV